jgi:hypothetical protein
MAHVYPRLRRHSLFGARGIETSLRAMSKDETSSAAEGEPLRIMYNPPKLPTPMYLLVVVCPLKIRVLFQTLAYYRIAPCNSESDDVPYS